MSAFEASKAANTNGVTAEDILRCYDKIALSLAMFLSQELPGEEREAVAGALILFASKLTGGPK